ncbi:MAG: WD40/YVTN/BNR-like repeat-containing protein [Acidobacteriota bacterium]
MWTSLGPFVPGGVTAVAVDPKTPQIVYVGSRGGLFRSANFATTWQSASAGIEGTVVEAIAIDPKNTAKLFVGTDNGIYRSTDSGTSWEAVYPTSFQTVTSIAVDPAVSSIVYATSVTFGPAPTTLPTSGKLLKSFDGGSSWTPIAIAPMGPVPYQVAVDPSVSGLLYAVTSLGVYRSGDSGGHWILRLAPNANFAAITRLALDPDSPSTLYAGTDGAGSNAVLRSLDRGDAWSALAAGPPNGASGDEYVYALAVVSGPPKTVYASTPAGLWKTSNGGASWVAAASGVEGLVGVLTPFGKPGTALYAGSDAGLFKLQTTATAAIALDSPFAVLPVQAFVQAPGASRALYAATSSGVYKSSASGSDWVAVNTGLTDLDVRALAMSPQVPAGCPAPCFLEPPIYAATLSGLFKSSDGGAKWSSINRGLPSRRVSFVAVDPRQASTLYATTLGNGVARSTDGGTSWAPANEGLAAPNVVALAIDPVASSTLYAAGSGDVFKSVDGASTWSPLHAGFAATALAVAPSAPATVYAAAGGTVYRSRDAGATWEALPSGLASGDGGATSLLSLVVDPSSSSNVLAGSEQDGVFRTAPGGGSWSAFNKGLPHASSSANAAYASVPALAADAGLPSRFYAATSMGLFAVTAPPPEAEVCLPADDTLCLTGGRFRVRVSWRAVHLGTSGEGHAVRLTSDTGYFWFFQDTNVELAIKVLDARTIDGRFWVFYGALSNVEYTITVRDTQTGQERSYFNPQDTLASVADTAAFPIEPAGGSSAERASALGPAAARERAEIDALARSASGISPAGEEESCAGGPTALCLNGGRFRVEVAWAARNLGTSGLGQAVGLTSDTGYFWFFQSTNVELVIKVLDARILDGNFWVFYGALSDVEYTITVTDTATGEQKIYRNPQGTLASVADTAAF